MNDAAAIQKALKNVQVRDNALQKAVANKDMVAAVTHAAMARQVGPSSLATEIELRI